MLDYFKTIEETDIEEDSKSPLTRRRSKSAREEFSNDRAIDYWLDKEEDDNKLPEPKANTSEAYIDFGLGSVTYWGVSRFVFDETRKVLNHAKGVSQRFAYSIILVLITVLPVFSQDMYSHMVTPMNVPESYSNPRTPLPLPYFNSCYHTEYSDFYLKQLYYDSVYKYIYRRTHSNNNSTISRTN